MRVQYRHFLFCLQYLLDHNCFGPEKSQHFLFCEKKLAKSFWKMGTKIFRPITLILLQSMDL